MRIIILTAIFCFYSYAKGRCDSIVSALANNYTQMHDVNIIYESVILAELSPYAIKDYAKAGKKVESTWETHIFFCANKRGFYLGKARLGKNADFYSFSYDGITYASFDGPGKILQISKESAKVPPTVWNSEPLVFPAAMLAKSHNVHGQIDCLWRDVTDSTFWKTAPFLFAASGEGQLTGMVDNNRITLTFSGENSPLGISGWESYQGTWGKPWMKYTCNDIGKVPFEHNGRKADFAFAKQAVLQTFYRTGDLAKTDVIKITDISLNDPLFDESKFTVGPALVARIFDIDSKKWIVTPK